MRSGKGVFSQLDDFYFHQSYSLKNLPSKTQIFGREDFINNIGNEWKFMEVKKILIYGELGVGKTVVIINIAHELSLKTRYSIIKYIDLKSSSADLNSFDSFIRYIGIFLEIGEFNFKLGTNERVAAIYRKLSRNNSLFVIDNYSNKIDSKIKEFILGLPSNVDIVASSIIKTNEFSNSYHLECLDQPHSLKIINKYASEISTDESSLIYKISEGNPKTILWILKIMEQGYSLNQIIYDIQNGNSSIQEYYFSGIWNQLDEKIKEALTIFLIIEIIDLKSPIDIGVITDISLFNKNEILIQFYDLYMYGFLIKKN